MIDNYISLKEICGLIFWAALKFCWEALIWYSIHMQTESLVLPTNQSDKTLNSILLICLTTDSILHCIYAILLNFARGGGDLCFSNIFCIPLLFIEFIKKENCLNIWINKWNLYQNISNISSQQRFWEYRFHEHSSSINKYRKIVPPQEKKILKKNSFVVLCLLFCLFCFWFLLHVILVCCWKSTAMDNLYI